MGCIGDNIIVTNIGMCNCVHIVANVKMQLILSYGKAITIESWN